MVRAVAMRHIGEFRGDPRHERILPVREPEGHGLAQGLGPLLGLRDQAAHLVRRGRDQRFGEPGAFLGQLADDVERLVALLGLEAIDREDDLVDRSILRQQYAPVDEIILSIDGLQPEQGHETLYVVRELTQKRAWFAEPLISATADEVRRLITKAKEWAEALGKTVALWLSDRQDAFVTGIAAEFPDVPHRYCANHFLRDVAKPVLDADSHAKVRMRKKVRGLRTIEQAVLLRRASPGREPSTDENAPVEAGAIPGEAASPAGPASSTPGEDAVGGVVLDYCTAVRGILNDDQGGPLHPPGVRMAEALTEVRASLGRNLGLNGPGPAHGYLQRLAGCIDRGLAEARGRQEQVSEQVKEI